ncbi:MAG: MBL fold metallo-hydrolase [Chloroflexota bacterium]
MSITSICVTCGTQYPPSPAPPASCLICEDERQYVGHSGQQWTTLPDMRQTHTADIRQVEPNLTGIGTTPTFAIGQRALLIQSPGGNVLWDCIALLNDDIIDRVNALGGINAIAISHAHYYGTMIEWAHTFDVPIYIHADDCEWVMRPDPVVRYWDGETHALHDDITLIRCGGHFDGGQVLHWPAGAGGRGVLLAGDIVMVTADRRYVSFMYSFPNYIPLNAAAVHKITAALNPFAYDRIYSAWYGKVLAENAQAGVAYSAKRYLEAIAD